MEYIIVENEEFYQRDGIGTFHSHIIPYLKSLGHPVHVLFLYSDSESLKVDYDQGNLLMRIPKSQKLSPDDYIANCFKVFAAELNKDFKTDSEIPYRIVLLSRSPLFNLMRWLEQEFVHVYKIFINHNLEWAPVYKGDSSKAIQDIKEIRNKISTPELLNPLQRNLAHTEEGYQGLDLLISLNSDTFNFISKYQYGGLHVKIENALPDIELLDNKTELRKKYGLSNKDTVCLYLGRATDLKGWYDLVGAIRKVSPSLPNLKVLVAGTVDIKEDISEIANHFRFLGFCGDDTVRELLSIADLGISTSYTEQCSYSVIKMLSASLPILISDGWGIRCMKPEKCLSVSLKGEVPQEIALNLSLFYNMPKSQKQKLARSSREKYLRDYSMDRFHECYELVDKYIHKLHQRKQ